MKTLRGEPGPPGPLDPLVVAKACYFHIRRNAQFLPLLDDPSLQLQVSSRFVSQIDYCNSLYDGPPDTTLCPFTKAFNSAGL